MSDQRGGDGAKISFIAPVKMSNFDAQFGHRLIKLREASGLRQEDVASTDVGFSLRVLSKAENGYIPSTRILGAMARFYGVTVAWLLTG